MNNDDYMNEYHPQLSKDEYDDFEKLNLSEKLAVEIGSYLAEHTRLDEEDAIYLIESAVYQLYLHYYPPLSPGEQIIRAVELNMKRKVI